MSFRLYLDTLATELQLGMHGAVEHEVWAVCVESRYWGVVGDLHEEKTPIMIKDLIPTDKGRILLATAYYKGKEKNKPVRKRL